MKKIILIFVIFLLACSSPTNEKTVEHSSSDATEIIITHIDNGDTISFSKEEINRFNDYFNMANKEIKHPDELIELVDNDTQMSLHYSSEVGIDNFYLLYSYSLRSNKELENYDLIKSRLVKIYRTVNSIHGALQHGGTYFGHQYWRAHGVAEYRMYQKKESKIPTFDFFLSEHKKPFIDSVRQHTNQKINSDGDLYSEELKVIRKQEIKPVIDRLDSLIDSYFYLNQARQYQMQYYGQLMKID